MYIYNHQNVYSVSFVDNKRYRGLVRSKIAYGKNKWEGKYFNVQCVLFKWGRVKTVFPLCLGNYRLSSSTNTKLYFSIS